MQKYDYSLKTWIIIAAMAVVCIAVDVLIYTGVLGGGHQMMKDSAVVTIIISGYILFMSLRGIAEKLKEKKNRE